MCVYTQHVCVFLYVCIHTNMYTHVDQEIEKGAGVYGFGFRALAFGFRVGERGARVLG